MIWVSAPGKVAMQEVEHPAFGFGPAHRLAVELRPAQEEQPGVDERCGSPATSIPIPPARLTTVSYSTAMTGQHRGSLS